MKETLINAYLSGFPMVEVRGVEFPSLHLIACHSLSYLAIYKHIFAFVFYIALYLLGTIHSISPPIVPRQSP